MSETENDYSFDSRETHSHKERSHYPVNPEIQIVRLEMRLENEQIKHQGEVKQLELNHKFEVQRLQDKIQDLTEQVAGYESEDEDELSGTNGNDKFELVKQVAGGILANAGESFLRKNPQILKGLGLGDVNDSNDEKETKQLNAPQQKTEATFSEVAEPGSDFSHMDEEHAKGLKNLIDVCTGLCKEDFTKFFQVLRGLYDNEAQRLKEEPLQFCLEVVIEHNEKRT